MIAANGTKINSYGQMMIKLKGQAVGVQQAGVSGSLGGAQVSVVRPKDAGVCSIEDGEMV